MSAPRLDKDTKDKIIAAYLAGDKIDDMAKKFGVHRSYPCHLARRRGVKLRRPCRSSGASS